MRREWEWDGRYSRESFAFLFIFFPFLVFLRVFFRGQYYKYRFGPRISPRGVVPKKLLKHPSRVRFAARKRSAAALRSDDYRSELICIRRQPGFRSELPGPTGETRSAHRLALGTPGSPYLYRSHRQPIRRFKGISTVTVLLRRLMITITHS